MTEKLIGLTRWAHEQESVIWGLMSKLLDGEASWKRQRHIHQGNGANITVAPNVVMLRADRIGSDFLGQFLPLLDSSKDKTSLPCSVKLHWNWFVASHMHTPFTKSRSSSPDGRWTPVLLYDDGYSEGLKEHWRSTYWNETMHDQASLSLLLRPSYRRVETLTNPQDCHHLGAWKKKIALKLSGAVVSYQKI